MIIWRFGLDWPKMRQKLDAIVVLQNLVLLRQNQIHFVSNSGKFIIYHHAWSGYSICSGCSIGCLIRCSYEYSVEARCSTQSSYSLVVLLG